MFNVELEEGTIFKINEQQGPIYFYGSNELTVLLPVESDILARCVPEKRAGVLSNFRCESRYKSGSSPAIEDCFPLKTNPFNSLKTDIFS